MNIRDCILFVLLVLTVAFYALLALALSGRALAALVRDLRRLKGKATASGLDRGENVVFESGMRGMLGGGRKAHSWMPARASERAPREPASAKAQSAINSDGKPLAA